MKKLLLPFVATFAILFSGCGSDNEVTPQLPVPEESKSSVVEYTIPAGAHYAEQSAYHELSVTHIKFKARFDSSAIYQTVDQNNQADINKLYGISDCDTHHQINSARFGWRWFNNSLEIWAYVYSNGERKFDFITSVPLNSPSTYEISFTTSEYTFQVNDATVSLPRHCTDEAHGYKLYPYFGGDEPAPHEVTIEIEDID
jgi:hypothetical protein